MRRQQSQTRTSWGVGLHQAVDFFGFCEVGEGKNEAALWHGKLLCS